MTGEQREEWRGRYNVTFCSHCLMALRVAMTGEQRDGVEGKIYCDILQLLSYGTEGSHDTWRVYQRWIGRGG
jgi:hypothetical protein